MQKDDKYIELISKYLAGEATKEETTLLEKWVLENEENKGLFNKHKQAWILASTQSAKSSIDVNEEWNKISSQLFKPEPKVVVLPPKKTNFLFLKIAAAILFLIAGLLWLNPFGSKANPTDKVQKIALSDGSIIHVNKNSSIQYPEKFDAKKRVVTLKGDAFFEVERNPKQPFVVKTQGISVEVLGTSFYIDSKKKDQFIKVTVRTGSVAMKSENDKIVLEKGTTGIYSKASKRLLKTRNEKADYIAWVKRSFDFDQSLEEVVKVLNEAYDCHIAIENKAVKDCPVTVKFTEQSLGSILTVLSTTLNLEVKQSIGKIILSGGSCKG